MKLPRETLTKDYGSKCFWSFYKHVSSTNSKLKTWQDDLRQLWQVIRTGKEKSAEMAIDYVQTICTKPDVKKKKCKVGSDQEEGVW